MSLPCNLKSPPFFKQGKWIWWSAFPWLMGRGSSFYFSSVTQMSTSDLKVSALVALCSNWLGFPSPRSNPMGSRNVQGGLRMEASFVGSYSLPLQEESALMPCHCVSSHLLSPTLFSLPKLSSGGICCEGENCIATARAQVPISLTLTKLPDSSRNL